MSKYETNTLNMVLLLIIVSMLISCTVTENKNPELSYSSKKDKIVEVWGIELISLRLTAANYMLDFRYRVHDAEKAAPLLDKKIKPYLLVEKSGVKLPVPTSAKLGTLRTTSTHPKAERNYFMIFKNVAQMVKPGDLVTVVVGDFKVEHIRVG